MVVAVVVGPLSVSAENLTKHTRGQLYAEQSAAPDCLQRSLLRRFRFRQQVSAIVRASRRVFTSSLKR
jgi:hypothetical protein